MEESQSKINSKPCNFIWDLELMVVPLSLFHTHTYTLFLGLAPFGSWSCTRYLISHTCHLQNPAIPTFNTVNSRAPCRGSDPASHYLASVPFWNYGANPVALSSLYLHTRKLSTTWMAMQSSVASLRWSLAP